ncbi:hypothetical protein HPP92_025371 [Vanilla planifolia]|uniref:Uncharacterized protein n=1 Tax=Vanilla planifolia TaxID=51239 RepID=A0A835U8V8_VANPL|nr:hypothetical protein HPP92_025371 [Vanilla planifolia]
MLFADQVKHGNTRCKEGASEEDICRLPKFKFRRTEESEKPSEISRSYEGIMTECGSPHNEVVLSSRGCEIVQLHYFLSEPFVGLNNQGVDTN